MEMEKQKVKTISRKLFFTACFGIMYLLLSACSAQTDMVVMEKELAFYQSIIKTHITEDMNLEQASQEYVKEVTAETERGDYLLRRCGKRFRQQLRYLTGAGLADPGKGQQPCLLRRRPTAV